MASPLAGGNVISEAPQRSVLGSLLYLIYINDNYIDLCSKLCKFAHDTKFGRAVANRRACSNT